MPILKKIYIKYPCNQLNIHITKTFNQVNSIFGN